MQHSTHVCARLREIQWLSRQWRGREYHFVNRRRGKVDIPLLLILSQCLVSFQLNWHFLECQVRLARLLFTNKIPCRDLRFSQFSLCNPQLRICSYVCLLEDIIKNIKIILKKWIVLLSALGNFSDVNALDFRLESRFFIYSDHLTWVVELKVYDFTTLLSLWSLQCNCNLLWIRTGFHELRASCHLCDFSISDLTQCIRSDLNNAVVFKNVCMQRGFI